MGKGFRCHLLIWVFALLSVLHLPADAARISLLNGRTIDGLIISQSDQTIVLEMENGERQSISTKYVYEIDGVPYNPEMIESANTEEEPETVAEQTELPTQSSTRISDEDTGCTKDVDCPGSLICSSGKCVEPSPKTETGTDKQCSKDTDCPGDLICVGDRCVEPASSAASETKCTKDSECPGDLICNNGICTSPAQAAGIPSGSYSPSRKDAVVIRENQFFVRNEEMDRRRIEALLINDAKSSLTAKSARSNRVAGTVVLVTGTALLLPALIIPAASSSSEPESAYEAAQELDAARSRLGVTIGLSAVSLTAIIVGSVFNKSARKKLNQAIDQYNGTSENALLRWFGDPVAALN